MRDVIDFTVQNLKTIYRNFLCTLHLGFFLNLAFSWFHLFTADWWLLERHSLISTEVASRNVYPIVYLLRPQESLEISHLP